MNGIIVPKLNCIENLINIEIKKTNNLQNIKFLIGTFSSDLTSDEIKYLNEKYIFSNQNIEKESLENHEIDNRSNKRRRLN